MTWTPEKIRQLRSRLGDSRRTFALRFGRSARTVEAWERAVRRPDILVLRELDKLEKKSPSPIDTTPTMS